MSRALLLILSAMLLSLPALGQDNPVTNGSFELADDKGVPSDWELLGAVRIVATAHSGENALLLDRAEEGKVETGLNREWKINSGEQGKLLGQLKGGLEFWYQAPAASPGAKLVVGLIAMTSAPLEGTGAARALYEVPQAHVGDGQWHRGLVKYDFTDKEAAKWVHVAARLYGGTGQLLLDDVKWVPSVGPLPKVQKLSLTETPGREGEACTLKAQFTNAGDQPLQAAQAQIILPSYLKVTDPVTQQLPATLPDGYSNLQWQVTGLRDRQDAITVRVISEEQTAEGRLELAPNLRVEQLRADRFLLAPGEATALRLIVRNLGNVAVRGAVARLADTLAARQAVADRAPRTISLIRPGGEATAVWTATLKQKSPSVRLEAQLAVGTEASGKGAVELICASPMPKVPAQKAGKYAQIWDTGAVVGNDLVRLVLAVDQQSKAGPAWLQVSKGGQWQTVGVLPWLGYVALAPASKGGDLKPLQAMIGKIVGSELQLIGHWDRTDAHWIISAGDSTEISYSSNYSALGDQDIYGVHGPLLYVGEGTWGGKKTEAVFPGLEWLVGDEVSSSTLDIASSIPQRWRWCPPPHAVTIPAMSVFHDGITVGLLWDQNQKLTPIETRPRAIFGALDRFEGRNANLLGLMAPGGADPDWWVAPRLATEKPLSLRKGQVVNLTCRLYAKAGSTDALSAMDRWFALYGAPKPPTLPHGKTWQDEIGFSAQGYLDSLWDPKTRKWFASLNGPQQMTTLGLHAPYLYDTVYASRLASDPAVRIRCAERIAEVAQLGGPNPAAEDMGFEFGNPVQGLAGLSDQVAGMMGAQGEDGAWRFSARIEKTGIFAGMDYAELGTDRAAASGTCAHNAYTILNYARLTGDPNATAAGLKALEFMKQFTVPRAAQVWEVPFHTPDVLASADASEAYLEGYLITGKRVYLDRAVFWARSGLPFCYMWDTPGYPMLRYASIPVFGASWFTCNWFGQPVQWNGLRLARAYDRLARFDKSYPWRTIAEGLTVSCMWEQHGKQTSGDLWPDTNEKWTGLWPDNFNSVDLKRCPWVFSPRQIMDMVYRLMDLQADPQLALAGEAPQQARIISCAKITDAAWQGDKLSATLQFTPPQTSQIVVLSISKPTSVKVNGATIPETARLATSTEAGWEYSAAARLLHIKPGPGPQVRLEISGMKYEQGSMAVGVVDKLDFGFDQDAEGWRTVCDLTEPTVQGGVLTMGVTGNDPYFVRTSLNLAPASAKAILIRLAVSPDTVGLLQAFWTTEDSPTFDEDKSLKLPLIADGQFHDYPIPVGDTPRWQGKRVTGLRFDPGSGPADGSVRIDFVRGTE